MLLGPDEGYKEEKMTHAELYIYNRCLFGVDREPFFISICRSLPVDQQSPQYWMLQILPFRGHVAS